MTLLQTACDRMNCDLDFTNPADVSWGTVVRAKNGTSYFTGHYGDLIARRVDAVTCGNVMTYLRSKVFQKYFPHFNINTCSNHIRMFS